MHELLGADATDTTSARGRDAALPPEGPRGACSSAARASLLPGEAALYAELAGLACDFYEPKIALAVLYATGGGASLGTRADSASQVARRLARIVRRNVRVEVDGRPEGLAWAKRAAEAARLLPRVCELLASLHLALGPPAPG